MRGHTGTGMLRAGALLPEIADVARCRRLEATSIYARVARVTLR
jgi:hypothetical protein